MPRKSTTPATFDTQGRIIAEHHAGQASKESHELATLKAGDEKNAIAISHLLGYEGSMEPDVLQQIVRVKYALADACFFDYAGYLALLRESTLHGDWDLRCDALGISRRHANQHISMFKRASLTTNPAAFAKIGFTKNRVLQTLDDEALEHLAKGESLNGVSMSAVELMSTRELREKVAKLEKDKAIDEETVNNSLTTKDQRINDLEKALGQRTKMSREDVADYKARPLGSLVAEQVNLTVRFSEEVKMLLETGDELLVGQAQKALTYAVQQILRVANDHHIPLDAAELSLDLDGYEDKVLGLVAYKA